MAWSNTSSILKYCVLIHPQNHSIEHIFISLIPYFLLFTLVIANAKPVADLRIFVCKPCGKLNIYGRLEIQKRKRGVFLGENFDKIFKNTVFTSMLFPTRKVSIAKTVTPNIGTLVEIFCYFLYAVRCSRTRVILQNLNF